MRKEERRQIARYARRNRRRSIWKKFVRAMACVVVFCTTYALILPAITAERQYSCGFEAHTHSESCYGTEIQNRPVCTFFGRVIHSHDELCLDEAGNLICSLPEIAEHLHVAECFDTETNEVICGLEAVQIHTHSESCLNEQAEAACGLLEIIPHQHTEACFGDVEIPVITCTLEEHTHSDSCNPDTEADLENAEDWEATMDSVALSGNWASDLAAIAQSQIGYRESESNYDPESLKGYTRYGDWYGTPYGDWETMFVSFCLHYAGVPAEAIPRDSNIMRWLDTLKEHEIAGKALAESPALGDILIYTAPEDGTAHVAIITGVDQEDDDIWLQLVEGNVDNAVVQRLVHTTNIDILASCSVGAAQRRYTGADQAEDSTEPESTESQEPASIITRQAETENYIVTVTYSAELLLPEGIELRVTEYAKDSETYIQRCQEAGYELEWLLNIGFFLEDTELDLNGAFDIKVTSKQGQPLGQDIAHFSESGVERIGGVNETDMDSISFSSEGFSDFGGGIALAAAGTPSYPYHPHAVHTGTATVNRFKFYNFLGTSSGGAALSGCVFEITGPNGYTYTLVSGNDSTLKLPSGMPNGQYTITEVSVPDGYIRDLNPTRTFTVRNGNFDGTDSIGTFINHKKDDVITDKTAEVENYGERIYQVILEAASQLKTYEMEPIDVRFVVDQSNSMLFPAGLQSTGKSLTLKVNDYGNVWRMESLNLDKNKMYYIMADPSGTATVLCIWYNGQGWIYQDASYYAKAKHNNADGYQSPNGEIAIFPENRSYQAQADWEAQYEQQQGGNINLRANGGGLGYDMTGSSLAKHLNNNNGQYTYTVYTATNEYNRLHYLEEAMAQVISELADANPDNHVSITRFTKTVTHDECLIEQRLGENEVQELLDEINGIRTSGGTRQDLALEHIATDWRHRVQYGMNTYTVLITDGSPDADASILPQVYSDITRHANTIKDQGSVMMTVGLGMGANTAGLEKLKEIASYIPGTNEKYYYPLNDASGLVQALKQLLFNSMRPSGTLETLGEVVDEISDSFYPVAWVYPGTSTGNRVLTQESGKTWVLLNEGDWITREGQLTTAGAWDAAGQLLKRTDGTYYIHWPGLNLSRSGGWDGTFYLKAKEDFIGGNAIDTNKKAEVTVYGRGYDPEDGDVIELETPTVNVRLLDMNQQNSSVTVYLGDLVNEEGNAPLDSLKYFYENTEFIKLISDGGDILNAQMANGELKDVTFTLQYAIGRDLTDDEWKALMAGNPVTAEYTYDNASSHGPVGKFTFRLEARGIAGASPGYDVHTATAACAPNGYHQGEEAAETYILHVTYEAYELGESGRPSGNVHNSGPGPGTEVGTGLTLPTGKGEVVKENIHRVHVISGSIVITKRFADGITCPEDRTFTFVLHREEGGEDVVKTITIPAGKALGEADIVFDNLPRGTYTVTEAADEDYMVQQITVLNNETYVTNCYSNPAIGGSGLEVTFVMGHDTANQNVIGRVNPDDRYTSYISQVNGTRGAAEFINTEIVYYGEVPVVKAWDDGADNHSEDTVYLVLYKDDAPYLDADLNARVLRLDASNNWQGVFQVILADEFDSVDNYNFSVREINEVTTNPSYTSWTPAILENDGQTLLRYDRVIEEGGVIGFRGYGYMVGYSLQEDGTRVVTNYRTIELPETGGIGTHFHLTFGFLLILAAAIMYICINGRKRRKGGR